jgi:hypothetical protein
LQKKTGFQEGDTYRHLCIIRKDLDVGPSCPEFDIYFPGPAANLTFLLVVLRLATRKIEKYLVTLTTIRTNYSSCVLHNAHAH